MHRAAALVLALGLIASATSSACSNGGGTGDPPAPPDIPRQVAVGPPLSESPSRPEAAATLPALKVAPLNDLVPGVADELSALPDPWGIAVYLPARGRIYAWNGFEPFPMASVAKVVIAMAFLEGRAASGVEPSPEELDLLRQMITVSDNDAADALWRRIGGAAGATAFLEAHALAGISFAPGSLAWGDGTASAAALSQMLGLLYDESFLTAAARQLLANMLGGVGEGQRWGMSAAFPEAGEGPTFGVKNGWFPGESGWWVASAALAIDPGVERAVAVALSHGPTSLEDAIAEMEHLAARIRFAVYESEATVAVGTVVLETQAYVFSPTPLGLPLARGTCEPSSALPGRQGAYACVVEGERLDPCFAAPIGASAVAVCRARPGNRTAAVAVPVTGIQHARELDEMRQRRSPWFVELEDGTGCGTISLGPQPESAGPGEPSYACSDGRLITEDLAEGDVWWAYTYHPGLRLGFRVRVATLWY